MFVTSCDISTTDISTALTPNACKMNADPQGEYEPDNLNITSHADGRKCFHISIDPEQEFAPDDTFDLGAYIPQIPSLVPHDSIEWLNLPRWATSAQVPTLVAIPLGDHRTLLSLRAIRPADTQYPRSLVTLSDVILVGRFTTQQFSVVICQQSRFLVMDIGFASS